MNETNYPAVITDYTEEDLENANPAYYSSGWGSYLIWTAVVISIPLCFAWISFLLFGIVLLVATALS